MASKCHWGAELGKLMNTGMFGHDSTCVYMSYRPNESSVPKQQQQCLWYTAGEKMSDKNLEQCINITFCVRIGKSASETAILTLAYGEYGMKK
jgi:hypothetical protein